MLVNALFFLVRKVISEKMNEDRKEMLPLRGSTVQ